MGPGNQRTETELRELFDDLYPGILGGLFNALSAAIRNFPDTESVRGVRMMDAATFVTAAEEEIGLPAGAFVLLGSIVQTHWVQLGDRIEIGIEGLGQVSARFV